MYKDVLVKMIKTGDEFNIFGGDIKTFQWLRTDGQEVLKQQGLGGGNLSLALIAVTQLDLLGQCYVTLSNQAKISKTNGTINQTDAFWKLVKDNVNKWGYVKKDVLKFWTRVRHKLVHQSYPKAVIIVPQLEDCPTLNDLQNFAIANKSKPFLIEDDVVVVIADALLEAVNDIKKAIIDKLENNEFDDSLIQKTIEFIKNEKSNNPS